MKYLRYFKENNITELKTFPAKYMTGMEDVDDLEQLLNSKLKINGKFTEESMKHKIEWAKTVDLTEPVGISIENDGDVLFNNGHHRVLAARILDKEINVNVERCDLKPEIYDVYIDRIKRGFSPKKINPDRYNLNRKYYEIPSLEIMNNIKNKDLLPETIYSYYMAKKYGDNSQLVEDIEIKNKDRF